MCQVLQQVDGLRVSCGEQARILIATMDVKNAVRQTPIDPNGIVASDTC